MKISDLIAKVTGLEARADAAFKADLETLRTTVNGEITRLTTELATANASVTSLTTAKTTLEAQVQTLNGQLSTANKLELDLTSLLRGHMAKVDAATFGPNGLKATATLLELANAEINATNSALAKTGVDISKMPAAPASTAADPTAPKKFKTLDEEIAWRKSQAKAA